jgi:hypothetical protein
VLRIYHGGFFRCSLTASGGSQDALTQQIRARPAVHLALDELSPVDLPPYLPAALFVLMRGPTRLVILSQSPGKVFDRGHFAARRGIEPSIELFRPLLANHLSEPSGQFPNRIHLRAQAA